MTVRRKVIAISGSTREHSANLDLIQAIKDMFQTVLDVRLYSSLVLLPHFNPDLDTDRCNQTVADFRLQLHEADGVLICTPEYAMGVPGSLKNAIDWTVSSCEFSHKPVALITASSSGHKGHFSLMETLRVLEADMPDESQLVISFVKTKIKGTKISDPDTLAQVKQVVNSLIRTMEKG